MKIKTKLIASVLSLVAVASVPCLGAFAIPSVPLYENKNVDVRLGTTQECNLMDKSEMGSFTLCHIKCYANTSSAYLKTNTLNGFNARLNYIVSFLGTDSKTIVLWDYGTDKEINAKINTLFEQNSSGTVKEGHIMVTCTGYKQSSDSNYTDASTYVNYGFGYI